MGGPGGGYVDVNNVVSAGGLAITNIRAAGGAAGVLEGANFGFAQGGSFIFVNNHDAGNTQVTMQGEDGTY